jgi:predicted MFS family arabinose efflux permease
VLWNLPNAGSTAVGGSILNHGDLSSPFYLCGTLYVTSIVLFYTMFRRTRSAA